MKWQEYQEAVGRFFEAINTRGTVKKNITIPDKITGHPRQVDVWWEANLDGLTIKILIDAKKRASKIDVKDVEEIIMLAKAVKADKPIIVTNNEWTKPAEEYAKFEGLDLRIFTIDEATDYVVEDKWKMCKMCKDDCLILDQDGFFEIDGLINWWLAGTCRSCKAIYVNCQACGDKNYILDSKQWKCNCNLLWKNDRGDLDVCILPMQNEVEKTKPNPLQIEIDFHHPL